MAAARAAATALLRSAATKIASRAPPSLHPRRHFSRYARPGGYTQPPPPVPPPTSGSSQPASRYSRPGGYAYTPPAVPPQPTGSSRYSRPPGGYGSTPPAPQPPPPTTTARTISSSKDPNHHQHLPTGGDPSTSAASSEIVLSPVDCDATSGAAYLLVVGGFLFLCWAKRKEERDAAARQKADNERFDATMRDAYDQMMRVVVDLDA